MEKYQSSVLAAIGGLLLGVILAIGTGLAARGQNDALLNLLSNVAGAGIGSAITIGFAVWFSRADRDRKTKKTHELLCSPFYLLSDALTEIASNNDDLPDSVANLESAVTTIRDMAQRRGMYDLDMRSALKHTVRICDARLPAILSAAQRLTESGDGSVDGYRELQNIAHETERELVRETGWFVSRYYVAA